jgi:ferritin-like metal-binding protein YciE
MPNTAKKSAAKTPAPKSKKAPEKDQSSGDPMLRELFLDGIKDIYWAEKKLVATLPKMQEAATTAELQDAFGEHLEVTKEHVKRLEQVFELLGEKAQAKKCDAMEGLVKEGESVIEDTEEGSATRDVGLIIAAQKVEHYEIASYGSLAQLAKTLGLDDVKNILGSTLEEEKTADENLTEIAESKVNYEAMAEQE